MVHNWKRIASVAYGCAIARLALNLFLYFEGQPADKEEAISQGALDGRYMELL